MFEHFTDRGRRVVVLAQEESRLLRHDFIGSEHLLLALMCDDDRFDATRAALQQAGVTLQPARRYVEQLRGRGKRELRGHIPFSRRAKKVLEVSMRVSQRLEGHVIGEPHLLRAMLDVPDSTAYQVLAGFGVDTDTLARTADDLARACQAENEELGAGIGEVSGVPTAARGSGRPMRRTRARPFGQSSDRLMARAGELTAQRDALRSAIRRYGRHDDTCQLDRGCTCGFQEVLHNIDRPDI